MSSGIEVRPYREGDLARVTAMRAEAFRQPLRPGPWQRGQGRVLTERGEIVATTLVDPLGQFFGGRVVPSAAVSAVVVDPRHRGRGLSTRLLRDVLAEQRALGTPISVLYPSIAGVYRRAGYEHAGISTRYRTPVGNLPAGDAGRLEPWDDADLPAVDDCYRRYAAITNGPLARSPEWWHERILYRAGERPLYRYLLRRDGEVSGYIVYTQQPGGFGGYLFSIDVRDIAWTEPAAARALLALLASNRPFGELVAWSGPPNEPLLAFMGGDKLDIDYSFPWMLRLLDIPAAMMARGYSPAVSGCVDLRVTDSLLPENDGCYRIAVSGGIATAERLPAASRAPSIDVGALAALYAGWYPATTLARLGRLIDAGAVLDTLDALFAGPPAWMVELI